MAHARDPSDDITQAPMKVAKIAGIPFVFDPEDFALVFKHSTAQLPFMAPEILYIIRAWFVGVKLVHEITCLLHGLLSSFGAVVSTPPKDLLDDAADSTTVTTRYDNLGTMMEKQ